MGQLKNFMIEAEEAGADVDLALQNFEGGMLWDQAIAEAIPASAKSRLNLPSVSIGDAAQIADIANSAQASLEQSLAQIRTLLQQRDLVEQWDHQDGFFCKEFLPIADHYHRLQRALGELSGHDEEAVGLSVYVQAQL